MPICANVTLASLKALTRRGSFDFPVLGVAVGAGSILNGAGSVGDIARFTAFTVSLSPAVWVVCAVTVLAYGALPRPCSAIGWSALAVGVLTEITVKTGTVPESLFLLTSPFAHVNPYYRTADSAPLLLALLALSLTALGLWALRRRDLPA